MPPMPPHRQRLDPRAPLVLDTRELGRRAGSQRRMRLAVPAPQALGIPLIGVPPGAELELDLRLEAVMEGVLVTGSAQAPLAGECGRCLDPVSGTLSVDLQQLYTYPDLHPHAPTEDDDVGEVIDDRLDLEPALRDAVVLALPISPLCREDCPGLCPSCGGNLAELPAEHGHDLLDPRWAALSGLRHNGGHESPVHRHTDGRTSPLRTEDLES